MLSVVMIMILYIKKSVTQFNIFLHFNYFVTFYFGILLIFC